MRDVRKGVPAHQQAPKHARIRRHRRLFLDCAWTILKSLVDVVNEGGRYVQLGSGRVVKALPILAEWVTDRQEHELIVGAHQHTCYQCDVPEHLKDQPSSSKLYDAADVCAMTHEAACTGRYGGELWTVKYSGAIPHAKPILESETWPNGDVHEHCVQSWDRYDHFSSSTGFRADPNPLHSMPFCNINQICRYCW